MTPSKMQYCRGALAALVLIAFATPAPAGAQTQPESVAESGSSVSQPEHSPAGIAPAVTQQADQAAAQAATQADQAGISPAPAAQSSAAAMQALPAALGGEAPNPAGTAAGPAPNKSIGQKIKTALHKLNPKRLLLDHEYKKAAAAFPSFCQKWAGYLRDREKNNLSHVAWRFENGFETALYTGYSTIESCQAHQSPGGYALGKLSYEEFHYLIKAKTKDEALKTKAKPIDDTHTTEIFRWDKGKWFY